MKIFLLAAFLLSGQAPADNFCADVRAIRAGAEESPAFASLAGRNLDALLGSYCRMGTPASSAHLCVRSLSPSGISKTEVVARMAACLSDAVVTTGSKWEEDTIKAGSLLVGVTESGGPGAHVGRSVMVYFESKRGAAGAAKSE